MVGCEKMNVDNLDIGFRFLPPDEEIIHFFLLNKMIGHDDRTRHIREVELLKQEPWDLPALSIVGSKYPEWLFFYKLNKISEGKAGRATQEGYWKSTGQDREISYRGRVIGTKKTLVFYRGRTPRGVRTDWVMHEYRAKADYIPPKAESSYVVGCLRNKAAENPESSISTDGQPETHFAESSNNAAAGFVPMEVAPQPPNNSMDYEIALQTQMEDQGIFGYELSPFIDLPSSSALSSNNHNRLEEEGISEDDLNLLISNDERNEWQHHFDTIEEEMDFMTNTFPDQDEYHLPPDCWAPDYDEGDHFARMSDGTGYGHLEGFNRMESGVRHDEILIMNSSVDSATVTSHDVNGLELVQEEKSVNSRTCKSQYEPRSHKSVVQGHPKSVQLQGKSSGKAVSRDKTRESGVRGAAVELVRYKKSIVQSNKDSRMDPDKNTKSDLSSKSNGSAGSRRKNTFNFLEMSDLSCKPNQPLEYLGNVLLGLVFMVIVMELTFLL